MIFKDPGFSKQNPLETKGLVDERVDFQGNEIFNHVLKENISSKYHIYEPLILTSWDIQPGLDLPFSIAMLVFQRETLQQRNKIPPPGYWREGSFWGICPVGWRAEKLRSQERGKTASNPKEFRGLSE